MTTEPQFLTLADVAERLHCSVSTVERRVRSGEIPSVRSGGLRRVRARDLERYTESLQTAVATVPNEITEKARRAMARR